MTPEHDATWIETETVGPPRWLTGALTAAAVITGVIWTVALVLLAVWVGAA